MSERVYSVEEWIEVLREELRSAARTSFFGRYTVEIYDGDVKRIERVESIVEPKKLRRPPST